MLDAGSVLNHFPLSNPISSKAFPSDACFQPGRENGRSIKGESSRSKDERWKDIKKEGGEGSLHHPALGEELQVHLEVRLNPVGELSGGIFDAAALRFIMHAILNQTNR